MTQAEAVRRIKERLEGHPGPVLSVYLSVNARYPENQRQAYKTRLKDALGELEVPEEIGGRVQEEVEELYRPRARTLVFFAAEDGLFEHEPYGVALFDAERFRFFVSAPMEEPGKGSHGGSSGFFREIDIRPSSPYPRGGLDLDHVSRRTEANVHKWYNELGKLTRDLAFQDGVRHLILAGPKERTADFRSRLPEDIKERVVAEESIPSEAPERGFFERLEAVHERTENERKAGLIEEARENGVRGIKDTVEALQEGQVYHLVALWDLSAEIRWCDHDDLAITDIGREECPYCGRQTRVRPLMEVVIDLATARNARIDFVRGENEVAETPNEDMSPGRNRNEVADVLREEFEGIVGLLRFTYDQPEPPNT